MTSQKNIRELSLNLKKVLDDMWETFSSYQASTNLPCLEGCGKCCLNPEVDASTLEMIPMALKIYDEGKLDDWLERVEKPMPDHCIFYEQESDWKGRCGIYSERPALCRMFGVAGYMNKEREVTLSICKYISQKYPERVPEAKEHASLENTPVFATWTSIVSGLGTPDLNNRFPINLALKYALQKIALLAQYQNI